jgi:hypothetical protein
MLSGQVIIALIVCGTVCFLFFTLLKFWFASKCRTVDIKTGNSQIHMERNTSLEDKDIPYPSIPTSLNQTIPTSLNQI